MKVLQLEHAGRSGPNIVFAQNGRAAADIRRFAGVTKEPKPRLLHHTFNGAQALLGGLRRSFAGSPW
jgi:hypothetical protein